MSNTMTRAMRKKVRVTEGRHQGEPTCDNCGLMGLYIPDWEMFPTCSLHTLQNRTSNTLARIGVKWETTIVKKGGEA